MDTKNLIDNFKKYIPKEIDPRISLINMEIIRIDVIKRAMKRDGWPEEDIEFVETILLEDLHSYIKGALESEQNA